MHMSSAAAKKK